MAFTFINSYLQGVYEDVCRENTHELEFLQAVGGVLGSLQSVVERNRRLAKFGAVDRTVKLEHNLLFYISWVDDRGWVQINRGYRTQFPAAIGPPKGDLRFHPSVNLSIIKLLGFKQAFRNSLTDLLMDGGKDDADPDPKGKSDSGVMRFCQLFMTELQHHIGPDTDVPAGDIGVGVREIGHLFGQYKRIRNEFNGVPTGKGLNYGGSPAHTEATGCGPCYFVDEVLKAAGKSFQDQSVAISDPDNVAIYANQRAIELGGKVIAMSDSNGYIVDENSINYKVIRGTKKIKRARIKTYPDYVPTTKYFEGCQGVWTISCSIALPCTAQNELPLEEAEALVERDCFAAAEGANMPSTSGVVAWFQEHGVLFAPAKVSNAGGVATSGLEMSQDSMRLSRNFEETNQKLYTIMRNIYHNAVNTVAKYGMKGNLVAGVNITDLTKVADAMVWQGVNY